MATDDVQNTFDIHRERRRIVGELGPNRRQREEAAARPPQEEAPEFQCNWDDAAYWHAVAGRYPIATMHDAHLWQTVIWCVRNAPQLHAKSGDPVDTRTVPVLSAAHWLSSRVTFRALARESVRRNFTYPNDVFMFLKAYLLEDGKDLHDYQPWQDPEQAKQAAELSPLAELPLQPPEWNIGKPLRAIDLG